MEIKYRSQNSEDRSQDTGNRRENKE